MTTTEPLSTYELREIGDFLAESYKLGNRREEREEFKGLMRTEQFETFAEWVIGGNYGHGPYLVARRDVLQASSRCNVAARLSHLVAAVECRLNSRGACQAWNELTTKEQSDATEAMTRVIADARKGE